MIIRKYRVMIMDYWYPSRAFFTLNRAKKYAMKHSGYSYLYFWNGKKWELYDWKVRL